VLEATAAVVGYVVKSHELGPRMTIPTKPRKTWKDFELFCAHPVQESRATLG